MMATGNPFDQAISAYGAALKSKLGNVAVAGAPEDQLRGPLEVLMAAFAELCGHRSGEVVPVGESSLTELQTRPDYAVTVRNALIGFIEIKAPGKGADPGKFRDRHDKEQWQKLKSLPNLVYTDGANFSLWRSGEREGKTVTLAGDLESAGASLAAPSALLDLFSAFLGWTPDPPKTPQKLAEVSARLCRLLRAEVEEQMAAGSPALTGLAKDWRHLLFPEATDAQFADGYAQAVTFGLLTARAGGISLKNGIDPAATALRKTSSLIGTALRILTDDPQNQATLKTSLGTLCRVLEEVNWPTISKGDPDAWLYFYEDFLEVYDNRLRKLTGSYYTPPEVVTAMVRLTDEALEGTLGRSYGFASPDVTVADPAVGTGTFLLGVMRKIAQTAEATYGAGAVAGEVAAAMNRLIGFELQFGPFAVAQLRLVAELQEFLGATGALPALKLFITDTLGNPFTQEDYLPQMYAPIGQSQRDANAIKRATPITVVIGNPPYKEKAAGRGGWIEDGSGGHKPPMAFWSPPKSAGAHAKHLKNLYVYFWRWATLKVFGSGWLKATGEEPGDRAGIVAFITVAGLLNGPGFQRMRERLREACSDVYVIDCSPEGHQPEVATRIFEGVQQPVCIVIAVRPPGKDASVPGRVHFRRLAPGRREDKFVELGGITLAGAGWTLGSSVLTASFLAEESGEWSTFPKLEELFAYNGSGVMPGRTWVIAPDRESLAQRWDRLVAETDATRKEALFYPHQNGDRTIAKKLRGGLAGHPHRDSAIADDKGSVIAPTRYAFRSFDRQWIIPDVRCINRPNPGLWEWQSNHQVYLTALVRHSPTSGPSATLCAVVPDHDHYKGSFAGRVFPLWRKDSDGAIEPNIRPEVTAELSVALGLVVAPDDVMAYVAAVLAHPAFTARFAADLVQPGLRLPLTADPSLFGEAVALGREVVWLHTYGERFSDPAAGRPQKAPRLPRGPTMTVAIPGAPEPLPEAYSYDTATRTLHIGAGRIENVPPEVVRYEVSGKTVLAQWFSYRRRDRTRPVIGDRRPPSALDQIQPAHWLPTYTADLIDLLHVLARLVLLEPRQADLLTRICAGPLLDRAALSAAGTLTTSGRPNP